MELLLAIPKPSYSSRSDNTCPNNPGQMALGLSDAVGVGMGIATAIAITIVEVCCSRIFSTFGLLEGIISCKSRLLCF